MCAYGGLINHCMRADRRRIAFLTRLRFSNPPFGKDWRRRACRRLVSAKLISIVAGAALALRHGYGKSNLKRSKVVLASQM